MVRYEDEECDIFLKELALGGKHNIYNSMAAALAAKASGIDNKIIRESLATFQPVEHRLEPVRTLNGVEFINDSIASSPSRTVAGLRALEDRSLVLIAGGYDKHIPYDELGAVIKENVRVLVLCGATAPKIKAAVLAAPGPGPEIIEEGDFAAAVRAAAEAARPGEIVILSPASASFDAFRNFEERGNTFKQIVREL